MSLRAWTPRQRLRAIQGGAALVAAAFHLSLLLLLRPDRMFHTSGEAIVDDWGRWPIQVILVRPPDRNAEGHRRTAPQRRKDKEEQSVAGANPSPLPRSRSTAPAAAAPAGAPEPGVIPGPPARPGVNWGRLPGDAAARRALRTSVGCDLGVVLSRSERDACDERMGRDRLKPNSNLPLMADRHRQAEFESQADYKNRLRRYKGDSMPSGHFESLRDMGGQPPPKP